MGLTNAPSIFQRMMEWVLREHSNADPYIDDVIVGSTGDTPQEVFENHERDVRAVLKTLAEHNILVSPKKSLPPKTHGQKTSYSKNLVVSHVHHVE